MGRLLSKRSRKWLLGNWGYALVPVVLWAWFVVSIGLTPIAIGSVMIFGFTLFQAGVPCGAKIRERDPASGDFLLCRNNASGILGGCYLKSHRWGNFKLVMSRSTWAQFGRNLFRRVSGQAAAVSAVASSCSAIIAVGALLVNSIK